MHVKHNLVPPCSNYLIPNLRDQGLEEVSTSPNFLLILGYVSFTCASDHQAWLLHTPYLKYHVIYHKHFGMGT